MNKGDDMLEVLRRNIAKSLKAHDDSLMDVFRKSWKDCPCSDAKLCSSGFPFDLVIDGKLKMKDLRMCHNHKICWDVIVSVNRWFVEIKG
jgi:hypothetical protein